MGLLNRGHSLCAGYVFRFFVAIAIAAAARFTLDSFLSSIFVQRRKEGTEAAAIVATAAATFAFIIKRGHTRNDWLCRWI